MTLFEAHGKEAEEDERENVTFVVGGLDVTPESDGGVPELFKEFGDPAVIFSVSVVFVGYLRHEDVDLY
jgi:hypothetical protein